MRCVNVVANNIKSYDDFGDFDSKAHASLDDPIMLNERKKK